MAMATQKPEMLYCPRCKERGVSTALVKATPTSCHYQHKGSPSITVVWGLNVLTCEAEVGSKGSGLKCGYQLILDQRIDNHT